MKYNFSSLLALSLKFEWRDRSVRKESQRWHIPNSFQMIIKVKKSDSEMFRAFINQCQGEIITFRAPGTSRSRARTLQPSAEPPTF